MKHSKEDRIKWFESAIQRSQKKIDQNNARKLKIDEVINKTIKRKQWLETKLTKLR